MSDLTTWELASPAASDTELSETAGYFIKAQRSKAILSAFAIYAVYYTR